MIVTLLFATLSLFSSRAAAQQSEPHQEDMMSKDMMDQHQKMMTQHQEMENLIDQLIKSFSVLENEKDPALLKKELAEHAATEMPLQTARPTEGCRKGDLPSTDRVICSKAVVQRRKLP